MECPCILCSRYIFANAGCDELLLAKKSHRRMRKTGQETASLRCLMAVIGKTGYGLGKVW